MKQPFLHLSYANLEAATLSTQNVGNNTSNTVEQMHLNNGNLLIRGSRYVKNDQAEIGAITTGT